VKGRLGPIAAIVAVLVAAAAALLLLGQRTNYGPRPSGQRPELLLLTSLPIVFPETFNLQAQASPVLKALRTRYRVVSISLADRETLQGHRLLLMAQPRAQPAEILVELDQWVRGGGHVLLLADPSLQWPSDRPLGDALRPPLAYADTGLIGHWGLRLDAPDSQETVTANMDGVRIRTAAPGKLVAQSANCAVRDGLVARCRVGKGMAVIIADADFIDGERFGSNNMDALFAELALLDH
jgi:hypothetical protein